MIHIHNQVACILVRFRFDFFSFLECDQTVKSIAALYSASWLLFIYIYTYIELKILAAAVVANDEYKVKYKITMDIKYGMGNTEAENLSNMNHKKRNQ